MRGARGLIIIASIALLAISGAPRVTGESQENEPRLAHSNGSGTLRIGDEHFKISAVAVKLISDHTAELTVVSDITIFLNATWSPHAESQQEFDLEITRGGVDGKGKVVFSNDGKSISRLNLNGVSRATKRKVEASFAGKEAEK